MKLESGRRVYMPSTKTFGTIVRQGGILGVTSSYAIVDDVGKRFVYVGGDIDLVYVDSSKTIDGEDAEIPPDVVPLLKDKYSRKEQIQMTRDLYETNIEDRENAYGKLMKGLQSGGTIITAEDKRPATRRKKSASRIPR